MGEFCVKASDLWPSALTEDHDTKLNSNHLQCPSHEIQRKVRSCSRFKEAEEMTARDNMTRELLCRGGIIGTIVEICKRSVISS